MAKQAEKRLRVAAVQAAPRPFDLAASVALAEDWIRQAGQAGATCVAFPEAFLGGYLKGFDFGVRIGSRTAEGRRWFAQYRAGCPRADGPEMAKVRKAAAKAKVYVVLGYVEQDGSTLYCSVATIGPNGAWLGNRRKLMPTAAERLVWGCGDGSTLGPVETPYGRWNAAICWENYMPQLRLAMYAKGVEVWFAPTVDDRDTWQATMRHIACEGRCFVVSPVQLLSREDLPQEVAGLRVEDAGLAGAAKDRELIRGGTAIYGPLGEVIAEPVYALPQLVVADLELEQVAAARFDFDPVGHYSRPDVFTLLVDEGAKAPVQMGQGPAKRRKR